jgi:molybdate transport system substrate-binding protein
LQIVATPNMRAVLPGLVSSYARNGSPRVSVAYLSPSEIKSRIESGSGVDVAIAPKPMTDALTKQGQLTNVVIAARSPIGVAMSSEKAKPDISSPASFKHALLMANSIVCSNNGPSGKVAMRLFKAMGIEKEIAPKLKLVSPGGAALPDAIASGAAELGIDQLVVFRGKAGIQIVGPLPKEYAADIVMGAGVAKSSHAPGAATDFIKFLKSAKAARVIEAQGMSPK